MQSDDDEEFPATQDDPNSAADYPETQERLEERVEQETEEDENANAASGGAAAAAAAAAEDESRDVLGALGGGSSSSSSSALGKRPRMAQRAEVVANNPGLARTISIDRLPNEQSRLIRQPSGLHRQQSEEGLVRRVLRELLQPRTWTPAPGEGFSDFCLDLDEIFWLCDEAQEHLEAEPTLLQLSAPIKVFGDIHGQYKDLMRLFQQYGSPSRDAVGGDISILDYLFLGDYVDRGKHSLETICLLLALKVQHPQRIFLVRGNHESPEVNARDGFLYECVQRLGGRTNGVAAWRRFNKVFEWLPMAAVINNCILGVHGGIGKHVQTLQQIAAMPRPLRMGGPHAELLLDLMWSDPTATDAVLGVHTNEERGEPVVCYGPDRVKTFLRQNDLSLIIRAHECVLDGWQRAAGGKLITVFSATNYCNRWKNAGALLLVGKDLEIVPKMIYPQEDIEDAWMTADDDKGGGGGGGHRVGSPAGATSAAAAASGSGSSGASTAAKEEEESSEANGNGGGGGGGADEDTEEEGDEEGPTPKIDLRRMRPPTPPRDAGPDSESPRQQARLTASEGGSMAPPPPRRLFTSAAAESGGSAQGSSSSSSQSQAESTS